MDQGEAPPQPHGKDGQQEPQQSQHPQPLQQPIVPPTTASSTTGNPAVVLPAS